MIDDLAASVRRHLRAVGKAGRTKVLYGQSIPRWDPDAGELDRITRTT